MIGCPISLQHYFSSRGDTDGENARPHFAVPITLTPNQGAYRHLISRQPLPRCTYPPHTTKHQLNTTPRSRPKTTSTSHSIPFHLRCLRRTAHSALGTPMDHHHYQPIWPLLEGAFDYTMNLFGEAWSMVWKPADQPKVQPMRERVAQSLQQERTITATLDPGTPVEACKTEDMKSS